MARLSTWFTLLVCQTNMATSFQQTCQWPDSSHGSLSWCAKLTWLHHFSRHVNSQTVHMVHSLDAPNYSLSYISLIYIINALNFTLLYNILYQEDACALPLLVYCGVTLSTPIDKAKITCSLLWEYRILSLHIKV